MLRDAEYVSVWDGGSEVRTPCEVDLKKGTVERVEVSGDAGGLDVLDREYVSLDDAELAVHRGEGEILVQIGECEKCGAPLFRSQVRGYAFQCFECDEDFYSFEQPRAAEALGLGWEATAARD